jgi:hypothetical protein
MLAVPSNRLSAFVQKKVMGRPRAEPAGYARGGASTRLVSLCCDGFAPGLRGHDTQASLAWRLAATWATMNRSFGAHEAGVEIGGWAGIKPGQSGAGCPSYWEDTGGASKWITAMAARGRAGPPVYERGRSCYGAGSDWRWTGIEPGRLGQDSPVTAGRCPEWKRWATQDCTPSASLHSLKRRQPSGARPPADRQPEGWRSQQLSAVQGALHAYTRARGKAKPSCLICEFA